MEGIHDSPVELAPASPPPRTTPFVEAALLLMLWSMLVLNEGAIRFNHLALEIRAGGDTGYDISGLPGWQFFASLGEVFFGMMGLFLGIAALLFCYYNTAVVKAAMLVQAVLGWFVFVVYVFVEPAIRARDLPSAPLMMEPLKSVLSDGQFRFLIVMGMFSSFHWCLALQGGQFLFMARLVAAATGDDFLKQNSGHKMRAVFWSGNIGLAGLWTLIAGSFINANVDTGVIKPPFVFPPLVGRVPGLLIFTGLLMLVVGVAGMAIAFLNMKPPMAYYLLAAFGFLFTWLNFTIVQFGLIGPRARGIAMHSGLVFMLMFLGPYFVRLSSTARDETIPKMDDDPV